MTDLLNPSSNRTCDVGVAGISATSDRIEQGAPVAPMAHDALRSHTGTDTLGCACCCWSTWRRAGYRFTSPTYESGRDIMIYVPPSTDMFLFLKPFDATVWLVIMATSVFVGFAVTLAEVSAGWGAAVLRHGTRRARCAAQASTPLARRRASRRCRSCT